METNLTAIIGGLIIIVCILIAILIRLRNKSEDDAKVEAKEFLEGLSTVFYNKMIDIITNFDISKYSIIEEFEVDILNQIYDTLWDYTNETMKKQAEDDIITALVLKVIDRETVIEFIDQMLLKDENVGIKNYVTSRWSERFQNNVENLPEDDTKQFEDQNQYIENDGEKNLIPADEAELSAEEIAEKEAAEALLNPQTDEVEVYSDDDASVEPIDDEEADNVASTTPYIIKKIDKAGKTRYYLVDSDGKKSQISASYVESSGFPIKEEQ
jgi:hypothetical protein